MFREKRWLTEHSDLKGNSTQGKTYTEELEARVQRLNEKIQALKDEESHLRGKLRKCESQQVPSSISHFSPCMI